MVTRGTLREVIEAIAIKEADYIAIHLGEKPPKEMIEGAKRAVEEAWGPDARVLFLEGATRLTIIRDFGTAEDYPGD